MSEATDNAGEAPGGASGPDLLAQAGFITSQDVQDSAYARILLLGSGGTGKTTSVLTSAPGPIVHLNFDGESATKEAARQGAEYRTIDVPVVGIRKAWPKLRAAVTQAANAGQIKTLVIDSVTMLADNLFDEIDLTETGFDRFNALSAELIPPIKRLFTLPCHVFVIGHLSAPFKKDDPEAEGIVPVIQGKAKTILPLLTPDRVLFDYVNGRKPERCFLLGPQGNWSYGCRRATRNRVIPANVGTLFEELGIVP